MEGGPCPPPQAIRRDSGITANTIFHSKRAQDCGGAYLSQGLQCLGPETEVLRSGRGLAGEPCLALGQMPERPWPEPSARVFFQPETALGDRNARDC